MKSSGRAWSLAGARALVGDVRAKTERAVAEVERLEEKRSQVDEVARFQERHRASAAIAEIRDLAVAVAIGGAGEGVALG